MVREWLHVITDPAHILGELTLALVEASIGFAIGRWALARHDRRVHPPTQEVT